MAYKRTGRPPGRPKTKWYVTVMTRIPEDLAAQAKRYAALHRHTMSDVLRDGLLLILQEQDPYRPSMSDTHAAQAIMSDVNPLPAVEVREIVSDTKEDVSSILYDTKEVCATVPQPTLRCGHPAARWNAQRRVCKECDKEHAQQRRQQAKRQAQLGTP